MIAGIKNRYQQQTTMLTDTKIRQTKPGEKDIKLTDSNGLYLLIKPNGSKLWRYRFRLGKKETVYAIGAYPEISLAQARQDRDAARELVKKGVNPSHHRQISKINQLSENNDTFKSIAQEWIDKKKGKTDKYIQSIERDFENYVYPTIGNMPIKQITPAQIMYCLDKCEKLGYIIAGINIRQRMSGVFTLAIRTLRATADPTIHFIDYFERPKTNHAQSMPLQDLKKYVQALETCLSTRPVVIAAKLQLLTATRMIEIRRAEWSEFDLDAAKWNIQPDKMKRRRFHQVPLPKQAIEILNELQSITGHQQRLFPNTRNPNLMMGATTINCVMSTMGLPYTAHDIRATAATHLSEKGYPKEYIDAQLSHAKENATDAAYFHARYIAARAEMMQDWADFLDSLK